MAELTLDDLTQRALTVGILAPNQLQELWQRLRTQRVEPQVFLQEVVRLGFLTSYQVDLLASGEMTGYFFGEYKALYMVGSGTFARVFRASHRDSGKLVALKVLRARFNTDPQIVEHFTHEAEIGIELRHPNIVPIYEVYSKKGVHFMVMDFIEGQTLRDFVNVRKKLDAKVATRLATDIAQGLDYAVRRGVQHRDLKLSNVLLSSGGKAMLADFGLAAIDETKFVAMPEVKNQRALDYAALERFSGVKRDDPRSDIYFLGCIYYNLLSGVAPLLDTHDRAKRMEKSRYYNVKPVLSVDPTIPQAVAFVVNKSMAFDPEKRYQSMAELLGDLAVCTKRLSDGTANTGMEMNGMLGDSLAARKNFGATGTTASGGTGAATGISGSTSGGEADGPKFTVMIVESDAHLQNVFRDTLKKYNYRALVVSTAERVMDRFYDDGKAADIVIFNAQTLGMSAIEGFNRMLEDRDTKLVPSILLLDDAHGAYLKDIQRDKHRVVLAQPITMRSLRETMERLLSARTGKPIVAANPTTTAATAVPHTSHQTEQDDEAEPILDALAAENGEFNDDAWAAAEKELMGETAETDYHENDVAQYDDEESVEEENVEYQEEQEEYEEVVEEVYEEEYEEEPAEGDEEYEYEEVYEEEYEQETESEESADGEGYEYEEVVEEEEVYEEEEYEQEPESEVAVEEEEYEYEYEEVVEEVYEESELPAEEEGVEEQEEEYEYEEVVEEVIEEYEEESESTPDLEPEPQSEMSHIEEVAEVVDTADVHVDIQSITAVLPDSVTPDTQGFVPSEDGVGSYWGGSTFIQAVLFVDNRSEVMSASVVSPISQIPQEFRWSSDANWLFPISTTRPPRNDILSEISPEISSEILPTPTEPEVFPLPMTVAESTSEPETAQVMEPQPQPLPEVEPVVVEAAGRAGGVSPPLTGAPLVRKKIVKKVVVSTHRPIGVVSTPPQSVPSVVPIPEPPPPPIPEPPPPPIPEPVPEPVPPIVSPPIPEPEPVSVAEVRKKVVKKIVKKVVRRENGA